jgi:type IV secretion system protein VirB11
MDIATERDLALADMDMALAAANFAPLRQYSTIQKCSRSG